MEYPRIGHACAALSVTSGSSSSTAVTMGGRSSASHAVTPHRVKIPEHFSQEKWSPVPAAHILPVASENVVWDIAAASVGQSRVLVAGGRGSYRSSTSNVNVYEYDQLLGFRKLPATLSSARDGPAVIALPAYVDASAEVAPPVDIPTYSGLIPFVAVGANQASDPASEVITFSQESLKVEEYPLLVEGPFGGYVGAERIPVICGGRDFKHGRQRTSQCFALKETNAWTEVAALPTPLSHAAAATVNDELWVFGGHSDRNIESGVWAFDGESWRQVTSMPRGLTDHCVVRVDEEKVLVLGGIRTSQ